METNAVTKVVTDEISITAKFISDLKMFAITKGLDLVEAIILFYYRLYPLPLHSQSG